MFKDVLNIISWLGRVTYRAPVRGTSAIDGDKGEDSDEDSDDDDTAWDDNSDDFEGHGAGRRRPGHQGQEQAEAGTASGCYSTAHRRGRGQINSRSREDDELDFDHRAGQGCGGQHSAGQ